MTYRRKYSILCRSTEKHRKWDNFLLTEIWNIHTKNRSLLLFLRKLRWPKNKSTYVLTSPFLGTRKSPYSSHMGIRILWRIVEYMMLIYITVYWKSWLDFTMDFYNRARILALRLSVFSVSFARYENREARHAIRVSREGDSLPSERYSYYRFS